VTSPEPAVAPAGHLEPGVFWDAPDADHPARRAARRSMAAVAAGDKDGWLDLFAADACVEDPVGPSFLDPEGIGHTGRDGIAAFWDGHFGHVAAFRFHVTDSFANGPCCANVLRITMTFRPAGSMIVDCLAVYTVDDDGRVVSMRVHWEPDRALATLTPG